MTLSLDYNLDHRRIRKVDQPVLVGPFCFGGKTTCNLQHYAVYTRYTIYLHKVKMVDMSTMTEKLHMLVLRLELGIEQKELADAARLTQPTISRIERGVPVSRQAATQAWLGLNKLRKDQGLPEVRFDDIEWTLTK